MNGHGDVKTGARRVRNLLFPRVEGSRPPAPGTRCLLGFAGGLTAGDDGLITDGLRILAASVDDDRCIRRLHPFVLNKHFTRAASDAAFAQADA
jgi:hypothetical protein